MVRCWRNGADEYCFKYQWHYWKHWIYCSLEKSSLFYIYKYIWILSVGEHREGSGVHFLSAVFFFCWNASRHFILNVKILPMKYSVPLLSSTVFFISLHINLPRNNDFLCSLHQDFWYVCVCLCIYSFFNAHNYSFF